MLYRYPEQLLLYSLQSLRQLLTISIDIRTSHQKREIVGVRGSNFVMELLTTDVEVVVPVVETVIVDVWVTESLN
jgi:hypothetical protein